MSSFFQQVVASWRHLPVGDMSRCGKMSRGGEKFVSKWKIVSKLLNRLFEVSRSGKKFDSNIFTVIQSNSSEKLTQYSNNSLTSEDLTSLGLTSLDSLKSGG